MSASLLAVGDGSVGTLSRLFVIAALLCVPYGLWLYRRARRERGPGDDPRRHGGGQARRSDADTPEHSDEPATGSDTATALDRRQPTDLRAQLQLIERFAAAAASGAEPDAGDGGHLAVIVRHAYRLDGAAIAPAIAVALLNDTARQCGLVAEPGLSSDGEEAVVITRPTRDGT